ncbi:hypothetical protein [Sphingomonas sp.]|jgi:hypothetical protein|uniref:hypothetical protein n=1 Tax=Sphingomonas sp. TaxID=28214 RepID=UPI002EDA99E9
MIDLADPVQRNIHAIMVRDAIVPDDASDMTLTDASPKQIDRQLRAMLPGVDFAGEPSCAALDDPPGRRLGRGAFNPLIRAGWIDGRWSHHGPEPHRLPESEEAICRFTLQQTHLDGGGGEGMRDPQIERLLGFGINDHARNSDALRANGPASRLFIAASILSAACAKYERARSRTEATGRNIESVEITALSVEAALIGTARVATEILFADGDAPPRIRRVAMHLTARAEAFRRTRALGDLKRAVRLAATAGDAVHLYLTRGTVHDIPLDHDRDSGRLRERLKVTRAALETVVQTMLDDLEAVDGFQVYLLLMARRLDVALARHPWLAAPHPIFRLNYAYIGGHALFAELERLGLIVSAMAARQNLDDGTVLDPITMKPFLRTARATHDELVRQAPPGRYLDLGAYHRAVTTNFIRRKAHWLSATVPSYTHHAYATGSRFCDLASAALDVSTHDFIRRSELDKPTQRGRRRERLVLFYGLDIEETVILALRQILSRLMQPSAGSDDWRVAFGRTVHRILSHTAPSIAAKLETTSCLKTEAATCKGLSNRATELARRFDDRDYDRPSGVGFDYALWFDRDRDASFWDRLQKNAKLYAGFGSAFIPAPTSAERESLPGRQGRRATPVESPPSRWRIVMIEAKKAFDAYQPLYLKSRPSKLTARIMARMNQGYSAFASDPQFRTLFNS